MFIWGYAGCIGVLGERDLDNGTKTQEWFGQRRGRFYCVIVGQKKNEIHRVILWFVEYIVSKAFLSLEIFVNFDSLSF